MFCKECGTENLDAQYECLNCKNIINTNFPLNGIERLSIIGFFTLTFLSILLFGFGIIPIIICLSILYIIKKDKNIKSLEKAKKLFLLYLIGLSITIVSAISYERYDDIKWHDGTFQTFNSEKDLRKVNDIKTEAAGIALIGVIISFFSVQILYFISNILFFKIIKIHEQWIIENGLFADLRNEKSFIEKTTEKIQTIKKESINVTDELLKWAELKEKGLITEEEFQKAKEKILEGKL